MADDPKKKKNPPRASLRQLPAWRRAYLRKQYPGKTVAQIKAAIKKAGPSRAKVRTVLDR